MPIEFVQERTFEHNGIQLAAKEWGQAGDIPVIALHGWLDNANSFDRMLPFLQGFHIIAVDMAGHSRSGFRSADSGYDIWQDIADVLAVADQMGWDRFALLGHSRGAIVSALVAGTFSKRVTHSMLIDGFFPMFSKPHDAAAQIAKAIAENKRFGARSASAFDSLEDAIQARINSFVPLQPEAAAILAERGVVESKGKFYWRNDQRLKAASTIKFTKEQCQSFFTSITSPIMLIRAESGVFAEHPVRSELIEWVPHIEIVSMQGSHHLHLEEQAQQVAEKAQQFFLL